MKLVLKDVPHRAATIIEVSGAIDLAALPPLEERLEALRDDGKVRVVLDLSGVRYVSSSGLGMLVKHATAFEEAGGGLTLLGVPAKVQIVIEMLGLETTFACVCKHRPGAFAHAG